jgi:hypothetical protein
MSKDSYWFKHDNNARNDEKILELRSRFGAEGYGIFWMIVETMAEDGDGFISFKNIGGLSLGYGVAIGRLSEVIGVAIEVGLFHEKDGKIFSNRMLQHKIQRKNLSEYGKKGAETKWGGHRGGNGVAIADPMADKIRVDKKRKEVRGVRFSEDGLNVFFEDGTNQILGQGQRQRFKEGGYMPHYIEKGKIE